MELTFNRHSGLNFIDPLFINSYNKSYYNIKLLIFFIYYI
jgi:hypothetical protein